MVKCFFFISLITTLYSCETAEIPKPSMVDDLKVDDFLFVDSLSSKKESISNYPDSLDFWINEDYLNCINSGMEVCKCLSDNRFVMIYLYDGAKTILLQSSIFYGHDNTIERNLNLVNGKSSKSYIIEELSLDDTFVVKFKGNKLTLSSKTDICRFTKKRLKTLGIPYHYEQNYTYEFEISGQVNRLNSKSLLAYSFTDGLDKIFEVSEVENLINQNKVRISCSDDYYYNTMITKGDTGRYFHLEYGIDKVVIYELPNGRDRYEKPNLSELKKQEFFKKSKN
ncbi:MAG: hypothetical protein ACPGVD_06755 [Flavobacteriales bacterium]